ncbi:hypothetical protein GCM10010170_029040 [Dactylosporangium salmoneum]|uniref:Uncharacterized protein n=1 Tax=Dactylosporangium salmoneum TaxID=53361 RepID=A0ABP5T223_9ACTN
MPILRRGAYEPMHFTEPARIGRIASAARTQVLRRGAHELMHFTEPARIGRIASAARTQVLRRGAHELMHFAEPARIGRIASAARTQEEFVTPPRAILGAGRAPTRRGPAAPWPPSRTARPTAGHQPQGSTAKEASRAGRP